MDELALAASELAKRFAFQAPALRILPLAPRAAPASAAVDGSQAVLLDAGGLAVVAFRAAVAWEGRTERAPLRVRLLERGDLREDALGNLRAAEEASAALRALRDLPPGGLLLLDGAPPPEVAGRLAAAAQGRLVAAVSKSTAAAIGGAPLLAAVRRAARGHAAPWAAQVSDVRYVVRASAAQEALFAVDAVAGEAAVLLPAVAALGTNPGVPGYPYLLALAHQSAVLQEEEQEDLRTRLLALAAQDGADGRELELAFHDYHQDLDLGA